MVDVYEKPQVPSTTYIGGVRAVAALAEDPGLTPSTYIGELAVVYKL